ncbi:MAG: hypothetical protein EHM61_00505 [Acidobacteria bacterium]|nr:MAG: hypothetical protein EHM61_00505 [Acidobacteriota bacterium]
MKARLLFACLVVIQTLLSASLVLSAASWENVGPAGGTVEAIAFVPSNPNVMYAVGSAEWNKQGSSVLVRHRSTDGGNTWEQMLIPGLERYSLSDVAVDFSNPPSVYVASEAGVFKSTDGGTSWRQVSPLGSGFQVVAPHPTLPNVVYIAGGSRILRSSNGGETWTPIPIGQTDTPLVFGIRDLVFDPADPSCMYIFGFGTGFLKTVDGGQNWVSMGKIGSIDYLAIDPRNSAVLYAGTWLGPYKTTDQGVSWKPVDLLEININGPLVVDPEESGRIYAGTVDHFIYVSENGGESWKKATGPVPVDATSIRTLVAVPGTTTLWAGCAEIGLLKSTDRGESWHDADEGFPGRALVYSLAVNPYDSRVMYAGTSRGVHKSTDGGSHWVNANRGTTWSTHAHAKAIRVNPLNPDTLYAAGTGPLVTSLDAGANWKCEANLWEGGGESTYEALAVDPVRPNILYASRSQGLGKSTDGGLTWTVLVWTSGGLYIEIDPFDPNTMYANKSKSTDGGVTWTSLNVEKDPHQYFTNFAASRAERGVLYIGAPDYDYYGTKYWGAIWKSTDGGQSWTKINLMYTNVLSLAVDPVRPGVVYYGNQFGVMRSTDGGASWSKIATDYLPGDQIISLLVDPNNPDCLLAGTELTGIHRIFLTHSAPSEIFLTSPAGFERIAAGSQFTIRWFSKNGPGNVKIEFSADGGRNYSLVSASTENDGEYVWQAPSSAASEGQIRVSGVDGSLSTTNAKPFSVVPCEYAVNRRRWPFRENGEESSVMVTSLSLGGNCGWTAVSEADWITIISGAHGTSDGIVRYKVKPYTGAAPRFGTLLVAGKRITIEQVARPCSQSDYRVWPSEMRLPAEGGLYQLVSTIAQGDCQWNAGSTSDWITVTGTEEQDRTALVSINVSANEGGPRDGNLFVGYLTVRIHQASKDEAASLSNRYLMPYLKTGYDPVSKETSTTGIAFSNSGELAADGLATAYAPDGKILAVPHNPNAVAVAPKTPLAQEVQALFLEYSNKLHEGWLELRVNRRLGVFFMVGTPEQMDGSIAFTRQSRDLYFTRVLEGPSAFRGQPGTTELNVSNPNSVPITVRMTLFGCPGAASCGEITRTIPAHGMCRGSAAELFGRPEVTNGYVKVEVTDGPGAIGFALLRLPGQKALVGLNAVVPDTSDVLYSAQLATVPGIFTDVKLLNTAVVDRKLTLEAVDEQGRLVTDPFTLTLSPGQPFERDAAELFPALSGFVGTLRVRADGPGVVGEVIFGDPGLKFASGLLMQTSGFTEGLFGHVAQGELNGENLFTGLALYNPGAGTARINIQVYRGFDWKAGERDLELGPGCRTAQLINELIPSIRQQMGGYIRLRSDVPIIAQELFSNGRFLSAVPPTQQQPEEAP